MLQVPPKYNGNPQRTSAASRHHVSGQYLARARLNRRQRARLAAELANGTAEVSPLTIKQAAALARVPALDVSKARRNGKRANRPSPGEMLAEQIKRTAASDRLAAARIVGAAEIWDTMISPVVSEERAAGSN
jgi:hypothetical protein